MYSQYQEITAPWTFEMPRQNTFPQSLVTLDFLLVSSISTLQDFFTNLWGKLLKSITHKIPWNHEIHKVHYDR